MVKRAGVFLLTLVVALVLTLSAGFAPAAAFVQGNPASKSDVDALKSDLERLKTDLEQVKTELRLLRQSLRGSPAHSTQQTPVKVSFPGSPILGKSDSPVTLIEFSDYQCPFCRKFFQDTFPALKAEYIDTGKIRYVFRDSPLDRIHPKARRAAEAAHCAGEQGKYWEMHDLIFQHQRALEVENLKEYAGWLKVDATSFDACLDEGRYSAKIQKDKDDGATAGVRGTPTFFVGRTRPDDSIEGVSIRGAQSVIVFRQEIEKLLAEK
jgi:protein-disulfide isomerase